MSDTNTPSPLHPDRDEDERRGRATIRTESCGLCQQRPPRPTRRRSAQVGCRLENGGARPTIATPVTSPARRLLAASVRQTPTLVYVLGSVAGTWPGLDSHFAGCRISNISKLQHHLPVLCRTFLLASAFSSAFALLFWFSCLLLLFSCLFWVYCSRFAQRTLIESVPCPTMTSRYRVECKSPAWVHLSNRSPTNSLCRRPQDSQERSVDWQVS